MATTDALQRGNVVAIAGRFVKGLQEATGISTFESQQQLLLLGLYALGEVNQSDLLKVTGVGKSSNGRNLDRLGAGEWTRDPDNKGHKKHTPGLGWVESYVDPKDRRYKKVRLTTLGRSKMDAIAAGIANDYSITMR